MIQIGYLILCEDVIQDHNSILLRKPHAQISPISIPGNYSFRVAFSLFNVDSEIFGKENTIRIAMKSPNDKIVFDSKEIKIQTDLSKKPDGARIEIVEADAALNNVEFFDEGVYTLTLLVNNSSKELKIPVFKRVIHGDEHGRN